MRLGLITCTHGRHELSAVFGSYYARFVSRGDMVAVCVGTTEDDARSVGPWWHSSVHPNQPLGNKFNEALAVMRPYEPDAVIILGSDDFVTPNYFAFVRERLAAGDQHICFEDLCIYDTMGGQIVLCSPALPGAARCLSRDVLDACNWKLWHDDINVYLDGSLLHHIGRPRTHIVRGMKDKEMCLMDVKTHDNVWCMDGDLLRRRDAPNVTLRFHNTESYKPTPILEHYFPAIKDQLLALYGG